MDMFKTFEEFLSQSKSEIPILWFILNLLFTGLLAILLKYVYIKYGNTFSNRKLFGNNFLMIAMTTMLIITIVKSSLALSLGLVGALSIIRFRAAIKEPEELAYLFLSISIGLGFGANQGIITILALLMILLIVIISKSTKHDEFNDNNLNLLITSNKPSEGLLEKIVETLKKYCLSVSLKRLDQSNNLIEASFTIELQDYKKLINLQNDIRQLNDDIKFSLLDSQNIF